MGQLPLLLEAVAQPHRPFCGWRYTGGGAAAPSTRQNRRPTLLRRPTQPELNCSSPLKVGWEGAGAVEHNMEVAAPPPAPPNGAKQTSPTMTPTDAVAPGVRRDGFARTDPPGRPSTDPRVYAWSLFCLLSLVV